MKSLREGIARFVENKEQKIERLYGHVNVAAEQIRLIHLTLRQAAPEERKYDVIDTLGNLEKLNALFHARTQGGLIRPLHERATEVEMYADDIKKHFGAVARAWGVPELMVEKPEFLAGAYPYLFEFYEKARVLRSVAQQFLTAYKSAYPKGG